jgi:hypothetical protein
MEDVIVPKGYQYKILYEAAISENAVCHLQH